MPNYVDTGQSEHIPDEPDRPHLASYLESPNFNPATRCRRPASPRTKSWNQTTKNAQAGSPVVSYQNMGKTDRHEALEQTSKLDSELLDPRNQKANGSIAIKACFVGINGKKHLGCMLDPRTCCIGEGAPVLEMH